MALLLLLPGCSPAGSRPAPGSPSATPAPTASPVGISATARIEPASKVVKLQVPADRQQDRVLEWLVEEGQEVHRGQLLVRLDAAVRCQQEVEIAQARVRQAERKLSQVLAGPRQGEVDRQRAEILRLQAELRRQKELRDDEMRRLRAEGDLQRRNLERYRQLFRDSACSALEVEQRQLAWTSAQRAYEQSYHERGRASDTLAAQIQAAQAELGRILEVRPTDVAAARADVEAAEAELQRARVLADECQIRAPQAGTILKIHTRAGERIASQGLAELASLDRMVAVAEVFQNDLNRLRPRQKCRLVSPALTSELQGQVVSFGHQVQRQNVFSDQPGEQFDQRVVEVRVALDGPSSRVVRRWTNLQLNAVFEP